MKKLAERYIRIVDVLNEQMKYVGLLYVPMTLIMIWEVISRFVFNKPTKWAWDINVQIQVLTAVMAGGYCLLHKGHVRMDIFYGYFSPRKKAWTDIATSFLHFLFLGVITYQLFDIAWEAVLKREVHEGFLHAPLYPLRVLMAIGAALFLLQIVAELLRNILLLALKKNGPAATGR